MRASKKIVMAGLASISVLVAAGVSQAADKAKVRVCHMEGGKGRVLVVSESAVNTHIGHGDPSLFKAYEDGSCEIVKEEKPAPAPGEEKGQVILD